MSCNPFKHYHAPSFPSSLLLAERSTEFCSPYPDQGNTRTHIPTGRQLQRRPASSAVWPADRRPVGLDTARCAAAWPLRTLLPISVSGSGDGFPTRRPALGSDAAPGAAVGADGDGDGDLLQRQPDGGEHGHVPRTGAGRHRVRGVPQLRHRPQSGQEELERAGLQVRAGATLYSSFDVYSCTPNVEFCIPNVFIVQG